MLLNCVPYVTSIFREKYFMNNNLKQFIKIFTEYFYEIFNSVYLHDTFSNLFMFKSLEKLYYFTYINL